MKRIFKSFSIALFSLLVITACSKSEGEGTDLTKPTAVIELDREDNVFSPGSSIVINGDFTDDVELKECQITLASLKSLKGVDLPWEPETYKIYLSGKEDAVSGQQIFDVIPVDIMYGEYQITFKVLDASNNYSQYTQDIVIE